MNTRAIAKEQKRKSLKAVSVLKGKRCGKLKGRTCVDGSKQRACKSEVESASPEMRAHSVMLTALVDACECRDAAVVDVHGVHLNAAIDEFVLLKMVDENVDVMCRIDGKCAKHVSLEKGKKEFCLMLNKALHGCFQFALLW